MPSLQVKGEILTYTFEQVQCLDCP